MDAFARAILDLQQVSYNRRDFVTVDQAADLLNRSLRTVRYWEKNGKMPPRKRFGKKLMYLRKDVEELAVILGGLDA